MRRSAVAAVVAGCALLVGCGGGVQAAAPAPAPIGEQPYDGGLPSSPLLEFVTGTGTQTPEEREAVLLAQQQEHDRAVVDCMAAAGFTYLPHDLVAQLSTAAETEPWAGLTRAEFAATYGFGVSTADELYGDLDAVPVPELEDPNEPVRDALDPDARAAYDLALLGGDTGGGCQEAGVLADGAGTDPEPSTPELDRAVEALEESITTDPRHVRALDDYTVCMGAVGHTVTTLEQIQEEAYEKYAPTGPDPYVALSDEELAALTDEQAAEMEAGTALEPAALAEVTAAEIAAAQDDLRCRELTEPVLDAVRAERENAFIAERRAELEAVRDSLGG